MGIFDDEARKIAKEINQQMQYSVESVDALNLIARSIVHDLSNDLVSASQLEGISVGINKNIIRFTSRNRTLDIICEGPDAFNLIDRLKGRQVQAMIQPPLALDTQGTLIDRGNMARRVLTWLKRERGDMARRVLTWLKRERGIA
jgi:hypothetical protein